MAIPSRILSYLNEADADFEHSNHPMTYTACELAHADRIPERTVAKTVVFLADEVFAMAVLPADERVDLAELQAALGVNRLRLATEEEVAKLFPDCEMGAMPPLGPLFGLAVYVDNRLAEQPMIEFNGGTHRDEIRMPYGEFARIVSPLVRHFGEPAHLKV
ncbi:MAG: deacylase [Acidobacteria bacterium]|nr:deacylase [Acidobacteriota bacterium]